MSDVPCTRKQFLETLIRIAAPGEGNEELTADLRAALLDFASETPDNLNCAERIEIGAVGDEMGLKIRDRGLLFSEVAHAIEAMPLPDALEVALPELTPDDWAAYTRLTTLIYSLLDRSSLSE